ncbi:MAG: hypothetical protein HQL88_07410 [Magnetococcales bacterium]|nr:hypothetical protein [Magnetococcales bacterium]
MAEKSDKSKEAPPPSSKKKCPVCKKGTPLWFISWADMVTLLLCLFVIIVAYSSQDKGKFETVAGSMKEAFGGNSPNKSLRPVPRGYHVIGMQFHRHIQLAPVAEEIQVVLAPLLNNGQANAFEDANGVVFQIDKETIFQTGTTLPNAATQLMLADIATAVKNIPNPLEIRSAPVGDFSKPFDWSAGNQEAAAVAALLQKRGEIPNSRIQVTSSVARDKTGEESGKGQSKDKIEIRVTASAVNLNR